MKKRISLVMALVFVVSMFSAMTASAAISPATAKYTAVDTTINGYAIQSFSINDHSVVNAEDLRMYGFTVQWDGFARALYISRADAMPLGTDPMVWNPTLAQSFIRNYAPYAGEVAFECEASDIKVFIDGEEIPCYVSHNMTFINIRDLAKATVLPQPAWGFAGSNVSYYWRPEILSSEIYISDMPMQKIDTADNALLTYEKAYEIATAWLANSIYAPYATIETDFYNVLGQSFARPNAPLGSSYSFNLFFDFDGVEVPWTLTVNQNGTVVDNIPAWITFFCTNF